MAAGVFMRLTPSLKRPAVVVALAPIAGRLYDFFPLIKILLHIIELPRRNEANTKQETNTLSFYAPI